MPEPTRNQPDNDSPVSPEQPGAPDGRNEAAAAPAPSDVARADTASEFSTVEGDTATHAAAEHRASPFATGRNFSSDGTKRKIAAPKRKSGAPPSKANVISPLALQPAIEREDVPAYVSANKGSSSSGKKYQSSKFRSVNLRFLLGLIVVFAVCVGSTMGLHAYQVRRLAVSLLDQQRRAARDGDDKLAARYLGQYLGYATDDVEKHAELAELLNKSAESSRDHYRALQYMEKVVRMDPSRTSIRRLLVDKLLLFGRYDDALVHLETLRAQFPDEGALEYKTGLCHHALQKYQKASIAYRSAFVHDPAQLEAYQNLAVLMRDQFQQAEEADKLIDRMVASNGHLSAAFSGRALYLFSSKKFEEAAADVATAHKISPKDLDVIALALQLIEQKITLPGITAADLGNQLARLVEETPREPRPYLMLAQLAEFEKRHDDAVRWLTDGIKAIPDNGDISVQLASLWVRQGRIDEAKEQIALLKQAQPTETIGAYLEAEILLGQSEWVEARQALNGLLSRIAPGSPLAMQTHLGLARCAKALRDPDAEVIAYRHILAHHPESNQVQKLLAAALAASGKQTEAMSLYEAEVETAEKPLVMAQLMIRNTMKLPPEKRKWDEVEKALMQAAKMLPDRVEVPILLAQLHESKGDVKQAGEILQNAQAKHPDNELIWASRIEFEARRENWDAARKIIADGKMKLGDRPFLRLAEVSLLVATDRNAVPAELVKLKQELPKYSAADQFVLLNRLASLHQLLGDEKEALNIWEEIVTRNPKNLNAHLAFLELAAHVQDIAAAQRELERLKAVEGENGPHWRLGRAAITLLQVVKKELPAERLKDVRQELETLKRDRPNWPQVWVMLARTEEQAGNIPAAILAYRGAIDRGDAQPRTMLRLIGLLASRKEYSDADSLVRTYLERANWPRTGTFYQMASEIAVQLKDKQRGVEYARKSAELQPADTRAQMWLAQLLGGEGESSAEIETALRKAIESDSTKSSPWLRLIQHLAASNRVAEAEGVLHEASEAVDEKDLSIFLASGYELLKQPRQAEEHYLAALSVQSDNPLILSLVSEFYIRTGALDKAEPLLDQLLSGELKVDQPLVFDARRRLATVWAQKDYAGFRRGLALLEENAKDAKPFRQDLLLRARLLAQYPRPDNRREAVRLFKELETDVPLAAEDEIRLTQLLTEPDAQSEADQRWQKLVSENATQPAVLVAAIRHFHNRRKLEAVEPVLEQLQSLSPQEAITFELSAENAARRGDVDKAVAIYQQYVATSPAENERPQRMLQAAAMASRITLPGLNVGLEPEAETKLLDFAATLYELAANTLPEAKVGLAGLHIRRREYDAAIDIYEQVLSRQANPPVVGALMNLTKSEPLSAAQIERIRTIVDGHLATNLTPAMKWQLASWQDGQGQNTEAIETYRALLAENEKSVIAMNNLAWLLALDKSNIDEAKALVERAMQIAGPISDLLDTRGVIEILAGEFPQAIATLEAAVVENDSASRRFHLALAFAGTDNLDAARFHMDEANRLGLKEIALDDQEVLLYRSLQERLQAK
ncbi:MAG: tetratricopeptide repeat protein [Planctomycetaceae bacterium]